MQIALSCPKNLRAKTLILLYNNVYLVTPLEDNNKYKSIYCYLPLQIYRTHLFCIQRYLNTLTK
jgi:hypothetical protein